MSRNTCAGFSLIELMVASVCLFVITGGVLAVTLSSQDAMQANVTAYDAHSKSVRGLDKLKRQLRSASLSTFQAVPEGFTEPVSMDSDLANLVDNFTFSSVTFAPGEGGMIPEISDPARVYLAPMMTDPENGLDDDGDGFTDGQRLVVERPGAVPETIATKVTSFRCQMDGRTIQLTLETGTRNQDGAVVTRPASLTVEVRND